MDATTRWIVRGVVAAVGALILWLVAPDAVRATFSGPGPFLRVAGLTVAFLLFARLVRAVVPGTWAPRLLVIVPAVAISWWALSPYVGDDVVNEDFPVAAGSVDASGGAGTDDVGADPADPGVVESSDSATAGQGAETPEPAAPTPAEPVNLGSGDFQGLTGHRGDGTATAYELQDGSRVLRLEDFNVSNGPGLEIHLVPGADIRGPGDGVKLADLKGNVGNQNYDIPADLDLAGDWTVLIWCAPFTVEVANATVTFG